MYQLATRGSPTLAQSQTTGSALPKTVLMLKQDSCTTSDVALYKSSLMMLELYFYSDYMIMCLTFYVCIKMCSCQLLYVIISCIYYVFNTFICQKPLPLYIVSQSKVSDL